MTVNSKSMVGIISGDSGMVIEYQIDEFTNPKLWKCFIALSHIYPGFGGYNGPLSTWTRLGGLLFLDQAVKDFDHGT